MRSLLLFLIFFPRDEVPATLADDEDSPTTDTPQPKPKEALAPSYRTALIVVAICVLHAAITAILSFYFLYAARQHTQAWADALGIMAAALASIQYFPQIYTTFKLKRVGSLSIPMMCIQTPGSFVWAGSLAARLGPEGWSAWGVYIITGCLQGSLLAMGVYFEVVRRRREKEELKRRMEYNSSLESEETPRQAQTASEETPLLRSD